MKCDIKKGGSKKVSVWKKCSCNTVSFKFWQKKCILAIFQKTHFVFHIKYKQYISLLTIHYYQKLINCCFIEKQLAILYEFFAKKLVHECKRHEKSELAKEKIEMQGSSFKQESWNQGD